VTDFKAEFMEYFKEIRNKISADSYNWKRIWYFDYWRF